MNAIDERYSALGEALKPLRLLDAAGTADKSPEDVAADMTAYGGFDISLKAVGVVKQWLEELETLDDGEGMADRLIGMLVGVADENQDGELDADEQLVVQAAADAAWDYLLSNGISATDLDLIFNGDDIGAANEAAQRAAEYLNETLADGDADIDDFVFGQEALEPALDATYQRRNVVRHGKKTKIMKRVGGHVRLSAAQKVGLMKARRKSHSAAAVMKRIKSFKAGKRMGLHA